MPLLAVGLASALAYALWVAWVPLLPSNLYVPLLDLGKITGYTWTSAALYLALVTTLYALYALGYRHARSSSTSLIFTFGAVFCAALLFAYPATAVDVFGYIAHGRVFALHGRNPFIVSPDEFPTDAIVPYLAYPGEPSQYGPVWVLLGGLLAQLAGGSLIAEILLYKAIAAVAHIGAAGLIYLVASRMTGDPARSRQSAYLFLWNPMLLWEMVANAHNDGVMMLGALAAAWLLSTDRGLLSLPALAAGALVKVPVSALTPIVFITLWRRKPAVALESALLSVVLVGLVYRPFWQGPQTLTALRRTDLFTASLGSVLRLGLAPAIGLDTATDLARGVSLAGFVVVAVLAALCTIRARELRGVLEPAYATMLAAALLGTTWFQAWYVVWPFALGAALASARRHLEIALLSLGGLLQYFVFIYLWVIGLFPLTENIGVQLTAYVAVVGPLVLGSLAYATVVSTQQKRKLQCKPS